MNTRIALIAGILTGTLILAIPITFFMRNHTQTPAVSLEQKEFAAYFQQANALHAQADYAHAAAVYRKAITAYPHSAQAYYNLGLTLEKMGKDADALTQYKQAIKYDTQYAQAYFHIAQLLKKHHNHTAALSVIDTFLAKSPAHAQAQLVKTMLLYEMGELDRALTLCQSIVQQEPANTQAYIMLGNIYEKLNNIPAELAAYTKAVELDPENPKTHIALADAYLAQGDYQKRAIEYEWRWKTTSFTRRPHIPLWDGSSLKNKTILLISENGLGDMIQYIRFIPKLKEQGARVVVLAQKPLAKLFSTLSYVDQVLTQQDPLPQAHYMTAVMSLPYYFSTTIHTLGTTPYIHADKKLITQWQQKLAKDSNFKIGICWQASPIDTHSIAQSRRTMPLETMAQLAKIKGVSLYSLQKGWPIKELEKYGIKSFGTDFDTDHGAFMDTAAVMQNLDLIITVDTVTAHLAGALNVPVWVALPVAADVRWMLNRSDTPWYSSMRLFRQSKTGDWLSVIRQIHNALEKKAVARHSVSKKKIEVA